MEINYGRTLIGNKKVSFKDADGTSCSIQKAAVAEEPALLLWVDGE